MMSFPGKAIGAFALVLIGAAGAWQIQDWRYGKQLAERETLEESARAANESAARVREQFYQHAIDKAVQDGQRTIDQLTADAATARASADSLRGAADKLAARLAASQAGGNSCTSAASEAASRAVLVLADVLKRADQRAGELAEFADQSHARGVTCEKAFDGLVK